MQFQTIFTLIIILIVAVVAIIFFVTQMGPAGDATGQLQTTSGDATTEATGSVNCFINPDAPECA
ncbi:MAG: hypothetical protein GOU97_00880 [Nanoarchaeota archaeon]|nr:hypothetical protein [Nanoarchaeota archaeon]